MKKEVATPIYVQVQAGINVVEDMHQALVLAFSFQPCLSPNHSNVGLVSQGPGHPQAISQRPQRQFCNLAGYSGAVVKRYMSAGNNP